MPISLEPGQIQLLQAVDAGLVARHRWSTSKGPENGRDLLQQPGDPLHPYRRVMAQMAALRRLQLVELVRGAKTDKTWPWRLTDTCRTLLEDLRERAETAREETA